MSRWRSHAIELFPEFRKRIEQADGIFALWSELSLKFQDAYRIDPPDDGLIARIYSFAEWCLQAPRNANANFDPATAVDVGFYEDIPTIKYARDDMPRWFTYQDVVNLGAAFAYSIGPEKYDELLAYMKGNQGRYASRPRPSS